MRAKAVALAGALLITAGCGSQPAQTRVEADIPAPVSGPAAESTVNPGPLTEAAAETPASGTCVPAAGEFATFTFNEDTPSPRCLVVNADQKLKVINKTGTPVLVDLGPSVHATLESGSEEVLGPRFGDYLAKGVHFLEESAYEGDPEVWLK